jgi:hypothetical protein
MQISPALKAFLTPFLFWVIKEFGFVDFGRFQRLIGVQDEDSCGRSELGETPQEQRDELS